MWPLDFSLRNNIICDRFSGLLRTPWSWKSTSYFVYGQKSAFEPPSTLYRMILYWSLAYFCSLCVSLHIFLQIFCLCSFYHDEILVECAEIVGRNPARTELSLEVSNNKNNNNDNIQRSTFLELEIAFNVHEIRSLSIISRDHSRGTSVRSFLSARWDGRTELNEKILCGAQQAKAEVITQQLHMQHTVWTYLHDNISIKLRRILLS